MCPGLTHKNVVEELAKNPVNNDTPVAILAEVCACENHKNPSLQFECARTCEARSLYVWMLSCGARVTCVCSAALCL
jgi:hypothetical protein